MSEWFKVGKIVNTHGIKGEVRVISQTDFREERYEPGNKLFIKKPGSEQYVPVTIKHYRTHKQFDLLQFEGLENINDVEHFKGSTLMVHEDERRPLNENEYYYKDIIGCQVVTEQNEEIGVIKEIIETGANDVWVIKRPGSKDALIPYIEEVVLSVDVEARVITIHAMEGLLD